jgi:hypothetical protein
MDAFGMVIVAALKEPHAPKHVRDFGTTKSKTTSGEIELKHEN